MTPTPWVHGFWYHRCNKAHEHRGVDGKDDPCVPEPCFADGGTSISGPNREEVLSYDYDGVIISLEDIQAIVLAVNSHERLVELLRLAMETPGMVKGRVMSQAFLAEIRAANQEKAG